tara:strand:- start:17 stop:637 length:621 start_codon:yes stop_codon:yes gene_type:complete
MLYTNSKVNKNNTLYKFDNELTRYNIHNEINIKLPFYFDADFLSNTYNLNTFDIIDKNKHFTEYKKHYDSFSLLEPYINFTVNNNIYKIKSHSNIHTNNNKINFYFMNKGSCVFYLIHPKYIDTLKKNDEIITNTKTINFIKNNTNILKLICNKNHCLYIPNNWIVYIENNNSNSNSIIEKIEYNTLIDKTYNYYLKLINKFFKNS